jgi:hypothetical protein
MTDRKKSTDPDLSAAERKALRGREAKEAITDHEDAQQAFHQNRERLRAERLVSEQVAGAISTRPQNCRTIRRSIMSDFLQGSETQLSEPGHRCQRQIAFSKCVGGP